jgi:hypothetical protein
MSSLVTITRNTETIQGYQIQQPADMLTALQYVSGLTAAVYTGRIECDNSNGTAVWSLLINNTTTNTSQFGNLNDWVILENNAVVTICKAANFSALYTQG